MASRSRFGARPACVAAADTDSDQSPVILAPLPGPIIFGGYVAVGGTQTLLSDLYCWAGLITTETAAQDRFGPDIACAFSQEAHSEATAGGPSLSSEIKRFAHVWRNGVIGTYGHPYEGVTPSGGAAPAGGLTVGFDAEWTDRGEGRQILSYQFSLAVCGASQLWFTIIYQVADGKSMRFSLGRLLGHFLKFANASEVLGFPLPAFRQGKQFKSKTSKSKDSGKDTMKKKTGKISAISEAEPLTITMAAHYSIVDITTLHKGKKLLRSLDTIRRSETTVTRPIFVDLVDHCRHRLPTKIYLRDSLMLAPEKSSLADLGSSMELPKVELPEPHEKSRMDIFRRARPDAYIIYSAVDSIVTLQWIRLFAIFADENAGDRNSKIVPVTIGSLSATMCRSKIMEIRKFKKIEEFDFGWRGQETVKIQKVNPENGGLRTVPTLEPCAALSLTLSAWQAAYFGGRNECFGYGPRHPKKSKCWWDWDVKNAYVIAMALVRDINWSEIPTSVTPGMMKIGDINPCDYFVGLIRFKFPPGTHFPCIPLNDNSGRGLIYPLEGEEFSTAPEICLALEMGAEIEVLSGQIHPVNPGAGSLQVPVSDFILKRAEANELYGKSSVQALLWKLLGTSAYGKIAQGLKGKRSYSTRSDSVEAIPVSMLTCAPYAALVTALIRALVSAVLVELHQQGFEILSVTTDGFLTDADPEALNGLPGFGYVELFESARFKITGERGSIWDCKSAAKMMVMGKTRVGFGVGKIEGYKLPSAAAGYVKQDDDRERIEDGEEYSEILAKKFAFREDDFAVVFKKLPAPRDYVRGDADGIPETITRRVNWSPDFKRAPDLESVKNEMIYETPYVSFTTLPHRCFDDFNSMRTDFDQSRTMLRAPEQVFDFLNRFQAKQTTVKANARRASIEAGGMRRTIAINILRAIRHGVVQISVKLDSSTIMTILGCIFDIEFSNDDWKNAKRRKPLHVLTLNFVPQLLQVAHALGINDWVLWAEPDDQFEYERLRANISEPNIK